MVIGTFAWNSFKIMTRVPLTDALVIVLVTVVTVATDLATAVVVGVIVWDSDQDAEEFEEVFRTYLEKEVPDHAIDRRGDEVLFATGIPPEVDASDLVSTAWKGVHTQNRRRRRRSRN